MYTRGSEAAREFSVEVFATSELQNKADSCKSVDYDWTRVKQRHNIEILLIVCAHDWHWTNNELF